MKQIIRNSDQTVLDASLQAVGGIANIAELLTENDISITDTTTLIVNTSANEESKEVAEQLGVNKSSTAVDDYQQGIDFWMVGINFKIG